MSNKSCADCCLHTGAVMEQSGLEFVTCSIGEVRADVNAANTCDCYTADGNLPAIPVAQEGACSSKLCSNCGFKCDVVLDNNATRCLAVLGVHHDARAATCPLFSCKVRTEGEECKACFINQAAYMTNT